MIIRSKILRNSSLLTLVIGLSACASVPKLGDMPIVRQASEIETEQSLKGTLAVWPTDKWWQQYNDAQLSVLIEEGLTGSPDIAIATARLRSADAAARQSRSALSPQVIAQASGGPTKQSYNNGIPADFVTRGIQHTGSVSLGMNFDLDLWGGKRAAARAALSNADAAALEVEQARLILSTSIANSYAQLVELQAERVLAGAAVKLRNDTLELVRNRVVNDLDTQAELAQAEGAVSLARGELLAIEEAIIVVRHQLAALLGKGPDRGLQIAIGQVPQVAHDLPANASTELVARRPDIRASLARVEAEASQIKAAKAAFYPSINISALIGFQALGLGNVFNSGSAYGSAGPAISLPIFDGGGIAAQYAQRRAGYDEAVAVYDRDVVGAYREVADAVAARQSLVGRIGEATAALVSAERGFAIARQRYEGGLSTYLDVLAAEQGVLAARRNFFQLETRGFSLDIALVRALGGGFGSTIPV
jgi:NodT family efflux transporter outer membrane factor (OMF) lipoprotein